MSQYDKIKTRFLDPVSQAVLLLSVCLLSQLISLLLYYGSEGESSAPWILAGAFTLFYAFVNAVVSLQANNPAYFSRSFYGYFMILAGSALIAYAFSGFSFRGAASIRWIFMIITFSYFIFTTIAFFMRKIINYAQRQDTEHRN